MPVESNPLKSGALAGLRVLDFTSRMGGYCGLLLANLGAEVILIEPPGGEIMRGEGPFKDSPNPEGSISFAAYHTNKQGIVLDLESENDRARLRHLVGHADVFIEDRPVAFCQRLGLGYRRSASHQSSTGHDFHQWLWQHGPLSRFQDTEYRRICDGRFDESMRPSRARPAHAVRAISPIVWVPCMRRLVLW